jgi:hypothetical protein
MQLIIRKELGKQNGGIYDYLTFFVQRNSLFASFCRLPAQRRRGGERSQRDSSFTKGAGNAIIVV